MRRVSALLLAACAGSPAPPPVAGTPAGLLRGEDALAVAVEARGSDRVRLTITGAPPGGALVAAASATGGGPRACKDDECFDLAKPLLDRVKGKADANGQAILQLELVRPDFGHLLVQVGAHEAERWRVSPLADLPVPPRQPDADGDGLSDAVEAARATDPARADSDGDGLDDGWELALGADPLSPDSDDDGLTDGEEWHTHGSFPARADSDRDGLDDAAEVRLGTAPRDPDTDDDGLPDGWEAPHADPLRPDSDGDGLPDGRDAAPGVPDAPWTPTDHLASSAEADLPDPEFEPDGRFVWSTREGEELWVGRVDPGTRRLLPPDGKGERLDVDVAPISLLANGPEWALGPSGPHVVYTVMREGRSSLMHAWLRDGAWQRAPLEGTLGAASPFGTATPADPDPLVLYCERCVRSKDLYHFRWRHLLTADPAQALPEGTSMGRWVSETRELLLQVRQPDGSHQVVRYDTRTGAAAAITAGPLSHSLAFQWQAPGLGGDSLMFAVVGDDRQPRTWLQLWRVDPTGAMTEVKRIDPPGAFPYVVSPEPVVHGGRSYVTFLASTGAYNKSNGRSEVWLAAADPDHHLTRRLSADVAMIRKDPESLTLGDTVVVYYSEVVDDGRRLIHVAETGLTSP